MNWSASVRVAVLCMASTGTAIADQRVDWLLERGLQFPIMEWAPRYEHGEGVQKDLYSAVRLYCYSAIRFKNSEAMYALGWIYANGRGLLQDDDLAAAWFRKAAEHGCPVSGNLHSLMAAPSSLTDHVRAFCVLPAPTSIIADFSREIVQRPRPAPDALLTARLLDFDRLSAEDEQFICAVRKEQRRVVTAK